MRLWGRHRPETAKGLVTGLIGGLAASWVMNRFQDGLAKLAGNHSNAGPDRGGASRGEGANRSEAGGEGESSEPAIAQVATAVSEKVFHHRLQPSELPAAETAVHYGYGTLVGGVYGMAAETWQAATAGAGTVFGAALWLGSDEIALTALGFAKPPQAYPAKVHTSALAAHVVYGVSLEMTRRALRHLW